MATSTPLTLVQGDTFSRVITFTSSGSPSVVNLTGATIRGDIRKEYNTDVVASFVIDYTDMTNGQFTIKLSSAVTAALPMNTNGRITSFVFDLEITYPGSPAVVETFYSDYLKVTKEVTK